MKVNFEAASYTKKQLGEFLVHGHELMSEILRVLSLNKIQWILESPHIDDNDTCLVLGLADKKMVAFLHLLPDILNVDDGERKVFWMIEWWVHETYKDTILGVYVYNQALGLSKNRALIKSNAESANEFYEKQPFMKLLTRKRYTLFFDADPGSILVKFPKLRAAKPLLNLANGVISKLVSHLNAKIAGKVTKDLSYKYVSRLDSETWSLIEPFFKKDIIQKSKSYINWQLDPRQYLQVPISSKYDSYAKIRGYSPNVALYSFSVSKDKKFIGFVSLLNFNGEVYVKYFVGPQEHFDSLVAALIEHCACLKVSHMFTDNEDLAKAIKGHFKTVFTYSVNKTSWAHKTLAPHIAHLSLKDRDGHFI